MIIAVDFDGTIAEDTGDLKKIGPLLPKAKEVLDELVKEHTLVLFTLREQKFWNLRDAQDFLKEQGMDYFKLPSDFSYKGSKFPADIYIDDKNVGGFIGWAKIGELLLT
jgi:hypothetical protein